MPGSVTPLDMTAVQIPYHFRCPISLELMCDPVTVSTGQTYDRQSIESWISSGHATCPVTRLALADFTLIPNHTLRRLIQSWCVAHRSHGVDRIPTPKQPADEPLVRLLIQQSLAGDITAMHRISLLARESESNRAVISTREFRSALVEAAFAESDLGSSMSLEALVVLGMIGNSLTESESSSIATCEDRLHYLTATLTSHPSVECRISAGAVIEAVLASSRSSEVRSRVGSINGVIDSYVELVEDRKESSTTTSCRATKVGIRGLFSLCLAKENRMKAVKAGAARAVVRILTELKHGGELERALATVELICRAEGGREAIVEGAGGGREAVGALVRALEGRAAERAAEHAAGALVAVVGPEEELQKEAIRAGVVPPLLVMVQSGSSDRAKRKAQLLLKLVRTVWAAAEDEEVGNFGKTKSRVFAFSNRSLNWWCLLTDKMLKGISRLNPNAAPYIPIFKSPSVGNNVASQELMRVSAKSEYVDEVAGCQLPNNASLELGLEELHVSSKSSSEMVHPYYSENNTIDDESFDAEKQTVMDETSIVMDFLVSRFPSYSAESLADFLKLNNGNLDDTIDFLEEFEDAHGVHAESSGTS